MYCPKCGKDTNVVDSRESEEGSAVRRRRECSQCRHRFTTYERVDYPTLVVIKKDGRRELFDPKKISRGVYLAFQKRDVPSEKIETMLSRVIREIRERYDSEVPSRDIGAIVLKHLKKLDEVAYVRFASVYREFTDLKSFRAEIRKLQK